MDELERHLFAPTADDEGLPRGGRMQLAGGTVSQSVLFHWRSRDRWYHGLRYSLHRAASPTAVDRHWLRLPHGLEFLRHGLRPLRLAVKYVRIPLIGPRA